MSTPSLDAFRYEEITSSEGGRSIVRRQRVVTARGVTLSSDPLVDGAQFIVPTADVEIYSDVVVIDGEIAAPGRNVTIVCRELQLRPGSRSGKPAGIVVDGTEGQAGNTPNLRPGRDGVDGSEQSSSNGETATDHPDMNGHDGAPGNAGTDAGAITIVCAALTGTGRLQLSAQGGKGGNGQDGTHGGRGGNGGSGRDAGAKDTGDQVLYGLSSGINAVAAAFGKPGVTKTLRPGTRGGNGGKGGKGGNGGDAGHGGSGGAVHVTLIGPALAVTTTSSNDPQGRVFERLWTWPGGLGISVRSGCGADGMPGGLGAGGAPGAPGAGGAGASFSQKGLPSENEPAQPWGQPGTKGDNGNRGGYCGPVPNIGTATLASQLDAAGAAQIKTNYLRMVLRRANRCYLAATDGLEPRFSDQAKQRLNFLQSLVYPMAAPPADVSDGMDVLVSKIALGSSYFGRPANWVPRTSLAQLQTEGAAAIQWLITVEKAYRDDAARLASTNAAGSTALLSMAQQGDLVDMLSAQRADTLTWMKTLVEHLDAGQEDIDAARSQLREQMKTFETAINNHFHIGADDVINSLEQVVFTEGKPDMAAVQAGKLFLSGSTKLTGDDGTEVTKAYVCKGVDRLNRKLNGFGELWQTASGALASDDTSGRKIAMLESDFDDLCGNLYDSIPQAMDVQAAMDHFADCVQQRNNQILDYNAALAAVADLDTRRQAAQQQFDEVNGKLAKLTADAAVRGLAADYTRALYDNAMEEALRHVYLAGRACSFWSLQPTTTIGALFAPKSGMSIEAALDRDIDALNVQAAHQQLLTDLNTAIERLSKPPQPVPSKEMTLGVVVEITEKSHPAFFRQFKRKGVSTIRLKPPTGKADDITTEFAGWTDVRINSARAWLIGADRPATKRADGVDSKLIHVRMTHQGDEVLVSPFRLTDPKTRQRSEQLLPFTHDPVTVDFGYEMLATQRLPSYEAATSAAGCPDGNFGQPQDAEKGLYAEIGPFALWRVEVPREQNRNLDLSRLERIVLEFRGGYRPPVS